ncbi:16S rRNA (guanine(966)-N(2))-methyltransferase RsmD [Leptolyngbya sp. PCC 6406]|uniref:16S rRNA (guanine(966)-N(2))-methyltransferase RsmD n=1 Tax=Leptolyngbya sp. PCC 6406 TaxID=1173264 RepID=UPI0002AC8B83|nr:16S rRNA (guanine(966)-N(2))-methyltransferase RsmD [Leptolyngbya sp. PCC 6406]
MALRIYGNRVLKTLSGQETRPTAARVREAVFNIWQGSIAGCQWLDLCAGNGVMGAEALCRGAQYVVGIEQSALACRTIRANWQLVSQPDQRHVVWQREVLTCLPRLRGQQFDHIYLDPPYHSDLYDPLLAAIIRYDLLAPEGELVAEHDHHWRPEEIPGLWLCRQKTYGRTNLSFFQRSQLLPPQYPNGQIESLKSDCPNPIVHEPVSPYPLS